MTSSGEKTREVLTSKPFKSLHELYSDLDNLAPWPEIKELQKNTDYVYSGKDVNDVEKPLAKFARDKKPKTLVCHDMKGGYLDDRFINGCVAHDSYVFYHWSVVDTFVYFSHYFVTIPPYGWINAAHINGVKILGTIITELEPGAKIWDEIFQSRESIKRFADALVKVAKFYKFDGWLLNVENKIDPGDIEKLKFFIDYLTRSIHREIKDSEIIWYDSVTSEGKLKWQNKLNDLNKCFFDLCDGIFLNYNWTDDGLSESFDIANKDNRVADIYVGIDVWGRGCPGGGGFQSDYALKKIKEHNLSVAIFGAGWTHEHFGPNTFEDTENLFWAQLVPYLYIHVPFYDNDTFKTSFCRGAGSNSYHLGQRRIGDCKEEDWFGKNTPFFNLSAQCPQLSVPSPYLEFLPGEKGNNTSKGIEVFLDGKKKVQNHETKRCIIRVEGEVISFQNKIDTPNLNYFQFRHNCSFNGGGCLELVTGNHKLYHRLFLIQVTFEHGIQVALVYQMDDRVPDQKEPLLVLGNEEDVQLISKYKTEDLEYPWRRNLYLTRFNTVTEIGVATETEGTITLGEITVEEKEAGQ